MSAAESAWLTPQEAAAHTGFSTSTLASWRSARRTRPSAGPDFRKVGRMIRYRREDLDRFIETGGQKAA